MTPYYKEYSDFLAEHFDGKIQKISVDLALGCPNRDGTLGKGGCIYCNNEAFSPDALKRVLPVVDQLARGKAFFAKKYKEMRFLAYFQSYTGTYAPLSLLRQAYTEALADEDVVGIVVGTRPDCIPPGVLNMLKDLQSESGKKIFIEFGVETTHDRTLDFINRRHTWAQAVDAVKRAKDAGFPVGLHLILGLPGESEADILESVRRVAELDVATIKFHQLQILRGTRLHELYEAGQLPSTMQFTPQSYAELCAKIIPLIPKATAIDRFVAQAPDDLLVSPRWGLKNYQFTSILHKVLAR